MPRILITPSCHPDRKHQAKGLCRACYLKQNGGGRAWYQRNKQLTKDRASVWAAENRNRRKEISRNSAKKLYDLDPAKVIARNSEQLKNKNFRSAHYLRVRLRHFLKGNTRSKVTENLLGCSVEELRNHIEKQFQPGMTWDNYGTHGWHIDHREPFANFDLSDQEQLKICFHYTNIQPLWAFDNQSKGKS